jgi:hypothetical protein
MHGILMLGLGCYGVVYIVLHNLYANHSVHLLTVLYTSLTSEIVVQYVSNVQNTVSLTITYTSLLYVTN